MRNALFPCFFLSLLRIVVVDTNVEVEVEGDKKRRNTDDQAGLVVRISNVTASNVNLKQVDLIEKGATMPCRSGT